MWKLLAQKIRIWQWPENSILYSSHHLWLEEFTCILIKKWMSAWQCSVIMLSFILGASWNRSLQKLVDLYLQGCSPSASPTWPPNHFQLYLYGLACNWDCNWELLRINFVFLLHAEQCWEQMISQFWYSVIKKCCAIFNG